MTKAQTTGEVTNSSEPDSSETLRHFSDRPGIVRFNPRPSPKTQSGQPGQTVWVPGKQGGEMVWAVDAAHRHNYLLPRDCPRVTFYAGPDTDPDDVKHLMPGQSARHVVAIESCWVQNLSDHRLYEYEFAPEGFECIDEVAGYWISRQPVVPLRMTEFSDLLGALIACDVELRIVPSLWPLREAAIHSTMQFSIIRMRNAAPPPPDDLTVYSPL